MPSLRLRHAWLQKHPSPTASTGEFHWHNIDRSLGTVSHLSPDDLGELRLALVDRLRGVAPPAALWQLAPGRVVWAQVFAATAPSDGRRYCGLAVTIAEAPGATAAELLASMLVPPAAPWSGEATEREVVWMPAAPAALSSTQRAHRDAVLPAPAQVVRVLISGGVAAVADPARPDLPAWVASLEAWLPSTITSRPRQGEWRGGIPRVADAADPVTAALLAAWCPPDGMTAARTRRAWAILTELAASSGRGLDDTAERLSGDVARALSADERARLPVASGARIDDWVHAIHHWGRGRLDGADDGSRVDRLADLVIARVLDDHAAGRNERAAVDHVRWHALLPAARRRALLAAMVARAPSIAELIDREPRRRAPTAPAPARRPEVHRA
jgi:hypothetical protein